jgi:predicted secreted protein
MKKFWKVLMIILDIVVIGAIIFGLWYVATHVGSVGGGSMLDVEDVFAGR